MSASSARKLRERLAGVAIGDSSVDRVGVRQLRVAEQRGDLRIGGDARGEAERVRPRGECAAVARQRERGAGVGTGEGEGLAHRSLRSRRRARRAAPCGRWRRFRARSSFSAPVTASADTCLRRSSRGAVGGGGDLGLGQRLLAVGFGDRVVLGRVDDLVGALVRLVDDLVGLGARFASAPR